MSTSTPEPSEEALRAAYEQEIKKLRVEHVLLDSLVSLINLGMRRCGVMPGTETERDPGQVKLAIEAVRAHMPLVEEVAPEEASSLRQALSQLQLAYVRIAEPTGGSAAGLGDASGTPATEPAATKPPAPKPGEPGPAQQSGRLWVPGQ